MAIEVIIAYILPRVWEEAVGGLFSITMRFRFTRITIQDHLQKKGKNIEKQPRPRKHRISYFILPGILVDNVTMRFF